MGKTSYSISVIGKDENPLESQGPSKDRDELPRKAVTMQVIISFLANLSVVSSGMGLGYPAITTQLLSQDDSLILTASQISWFASITAITCPLGGPLSGFLSEKIGRRSTLMIVNVIAIVSWVLIGVSSRDNVEAFFIQLMFGRALIGVCVGMITTPAVTYSSEVCHQRIRGLLTILSTPFFMAFGTLVAYLLGYLIPTNFRLVALIGAGITVVTILVLCLIPESPVYLVGKNKTDKARKALSLLRNFHKNDERIDEEIEMIKANRNQSTQKQSLFAVWKEFRRPELYKPFLIMLLFFAIQQFSGIFVIFIYAAQFSLEAGVSMDAFLSAIILGVIRCVTTVLIAFASDKYGRRPLVIVSSVGMFVSMVGLAVVAAYPVNDTSFFWLPAMFLFFFVFIGTFGILTLPFAMVAEMYPQKTRTFAAGITMSLAFLMSFANVKTFSMVFDYFGNVAVFSFYAIVALIGVLFGAFILPETKGKTLQEVEEHFKKK